MRGSTWLLLALAGWTAVIATELTFDAGQERRNLPAAPVPGDLGDPPSLPRLALGPLSDMSQTTARPLFRQNRRPLALAPPKKVIKASKPPPPQVSKPPPPPRPRPKPVPKPNPVLRYFLSAVVIAEGEASAYLSQRDAGELTRLRQGESLDGWRLVEIHPDAVVLKHGDERTKLLLRPAKQTSGQGLSMNGPHDSFDTRKNRNRESRNRVPDENARIRQPPHVEDGLRRRSLERALRRAAQSRRSGNQRPARASKNR